jgi:hypothetical protein
LHNLFCFQDLFEKADATVAAVRENLPSPSLEGGAFHFVDATAPDNTQRGIWLLVMLVVFMFVVIPLLLTLVSRFIGQGMIISTLDYDILQLEEKSEAEEALHHRAHHATDVSSSSV